MRTVLMTAALVAAAGSASAAPFKCPATGGSLVFAQEAKVNSLDQHTSSTISTRNIAMNMFESLMTRDEHMNPILELADALDTTEDGLTYTFKLRQGIRFHNGKPMTSADVMASFDRYAKIGYERATLTNVDHWEAPDAYTFILKMKKAQPTFLEDLSSFSVPIVIIPAELKDTPAQRLEPIGTGPFQLAENVQDSHVTIKRYDGYQPNPRYEDITGFGGYKVACLDRVTFRIVTEPGARVAGLETGEFGAVEDVPSKSQAALKANKNLALAPLDNWWIQITTPNLSFPPTDNLMFRKAVQAALDMDEIMDAASDGAYHLNIGFQYPDRAFYSEAGKQYYNVKNPDLARKYLKESGYKGEPVVLMTNKDYSSMYTAALVMAEEMKAIGINAQLDVVDWPASVQRQEREAKGWNFFFTGWGTGPALGAIAAIKFLVPPTNTYKPKTPEDADKEIVAAWDALTGAPKIDDRKAAFARLQERTMEQVLAIPFGSLTKMQAVRANVKNFRPFRIPRMSNVYLQG